MAHAITADVAARLGRPLLAGEITQVAAYLEDAESAILANLPTILTDVLDDDALSQNLKSVECAATLRAARLTDSVQAAYPSTEDWQVPAGSSRANVTILDSEWRKLGLTWYTAISPSAALNPPGLFSDRNPDWGPWGSYAEGL